LEETTNGGYLQVRKISIKKCNIFSKFWMVRQFLEPSPRLEDIG